MPDVRDAPHSRTVATSSRAQPLDAPPPELQRPDGSAAPGARLSFRLPAVGASPAEARRRLRGQLAQWRMPAEASHNAQLIVSELVTNALRHTRSELIACEVQLLGPLLRVAVASQGSGPPGTPPTAGEQDEGGRGLLLVCALAAGWGVRPRDAGRGHVVWADLRTDP